MLNDNCIYYCKLGLTTKKMIIFRWEPNTPMVHVFGAVHRSEYLNNFDKAAIMLRIKKEVK